MKRMITDEEGREVQGRAAVWRHGVKDVEDNVYAEVKQDSDRKIEGGSREDLEGVGITPESAARIHDIGKTDFQNLNVTDVFAAVSPFKRVGETLDAYFAGSGFRKGEVNLIPRSELGLEGINWSAPCVPEYASRGEKADKFVLNINNQFYFPHSDLTLPVMAQYGYHLFKTILEGVDYLNEKHKQSKFSVLAIGTHCPVADTLAMVIADCLHVDQFRGISEVYEPLFQGHVQEEEAMKGHLYLGTDNPAVTFQRGEKEKGFLRTDLVRKVAEFEEHSKSILLYK